MNAAASTNSLSSRRPKGLLVNSMTSPDFTKAGALIFDGAKRILIVKPKTNDFWIFVGGKREKGETDEECLRREIKEEIDVDITGTSTFYMQSPIEPAAGSKEGKTVQMNIYFAEIQEVPHPSAEIEKIHWLTREEYESKQFLIGSIMNHYVIPRLIAEGRF